MRARNAYASSHIFKSYARKDARNAYVKIPCADTSAFYASNASSHAKKNASRPLKKIILKGLWNKFLAPNFKLIRAFYAHL